MASQTRPAIKSRNRMMTTITMPTDRYLFRIRRVSVTSFRSGPVKGVTRQARTTPLMMPSTSQMDIIRIRAKILLLVRYTSVVVTKIRKALYRNTSLLPTI